MLLKVEVRLVPTNCIALIAATAIKAAIKPYSIAVAPSSFFHSLIRVADIHVLLWPLPPRSPHSAPTTTPSVARDDRNRRSLKLRGNVVEGRREAGSDQLHCTDRGNRDQGGDQT